MESIADFANPISGNQQNLNFLKSQKSSIANFILENFLFLQNLEIEKSEIKNEKNPKIVQQQILEIKKRISQNLNVFPENEFLAANEKFRANFPQKCFLYFSEFQNYLSQNISTTKIEKTQQMQLFPEENNLIFWEKMENEIEIFAAIQQKIFNSFRQILENADLSGKIDQIDFDKLLDDARKNKNSKTGEIFETEKNIFDFILQNLNFKKFGKDFLPADFSDFKISFSEKRVLGHKEAQKFVFRSEKKDAPIFVLKNYRKTADLLDEITSPPKLFVIFELNGKEIEMDVLDPNFDAELKKKLKIKNFPENLQKNFLDIFFKYFFELQQKILREKMQQKYETIFKKDDLYFLLLQKIFSMAKKIETEKK